MADREQRLAIIVTAKDLAAGNLKKVRSELAQMGPAGRIASVGLGGVMVAGNKLGGALGTLKGRIVGLAGAIGPLLGVGGLLGLGSLLGSSLREASAFGLNVVKVAAATNLAVPIASSMVDTLDKWGVSSDRLLPILGKLEKNVGTLAGTSGKQGSSAEAVTKATENLRVAQLRLHEVEGKRGHSQSALVAAQNRVAEAERKLTQAQKTGAISLDGAAKFQKQYGISLLDNRGKIADANTLLLRSADYFNSNASATDKATFMSKLWGKGWQDLIPILAKGSKFIRDQEADAIHLTKTQVDNIAKFNDAQRDFADTFGDVQVKVGAEVMPFFTSGLKDASAWFDSHGDEIAAFFRDAAAFAGQAADAGGKIFSAIKGGWDGLPGPLKELLVGTFVANKASKFLFNIGIGDVLKGGQSLFAKGSSPANPLFVSDVSGGLGKGAAGAGGGLLGMLGGRGNLLSRLTRIGGGLALGFGGSQLLGAGVEAGNPLLGAGGGVGMIAGGAAIAGPVGAIAGSVLAVAQTQQQVSAQSSAMAANLDQTTKDWLAQSPKKGELENGLAGVEQGINDLQANPLNVLVQGDALDRLKSMRDAIKAQLALAQTSTPVLLNADRWMVTAVALGTERGLVHSGVFKKAEAVREAGGFRLSRDALIAMLHGKQPLGVDALVTGQAIALAVGNHLRTDQNPDLKSAAANLALLKRLQDHLPADLASQLQPKIASLEAAIDRATAAINAKQFTVTVNAYTGAKQKPGVHHAPGTGPLSAGGAIGLTRGMTDLGWAGEAGGEAVAIVRNPRPIASSPSGLSRGDVAAIVGAIRQGMAGSKVMVAARTVTRATSIDSRYSNRPLAGVTVD